MLLVENMKGKIHTDYGFLCLFLKNLLDFVTKFMLKTICYIILIVSVVYSKLKYTEIIIVKYIVILLI